MSSLFWPFSVLDNKLDVILANQGVILSNQAKEARSMSALSDAVAKVSSDLDTIGTSLDNDSKAIQAAIAALQQPSPDVAAAVTALQQVDARLSGYQTTIDANTTALNNAVTPPASPPPTAG